MLTQFEVCTAGWLGWSHLENGELILASEAAGFDVMLTGDKRMYYQQNNAKRKMAMVVLSRIDWPVLRHHVELISAALERAEGNSYEFVTLPNE